MERDINLIVDIEPDEAQKLIKLIELLLQQWYIERHNQQELYADIIGIDQAKQQERKKTGRKLLFSFAHGSFSASKFPFKIPILYDYPAFILFCASSSKSPRLNYMETTLAESVPLGPSIYSLLLLNPCFICC